MDQIQIDDFNDKTYNLTTIEMIFMLKIYQEQDFDFLDHKGPKFNISWIQFDDFSLIFNFGQRLWSFEFCFLERWTEYDKQYCFDT